MTRINASLVALTTFLVVSMGLTGGAAAARRYTECVAPLPNLLNHNPVKADSISSEIKKALGSLDGHLKNLVSSNEELNSLSIGVVTPAGLIWSNGYGKLKANDTSSTQVPDKDSIYRVGSVTKVFTVLESLLLREKGVLELDEPIEKYIAPLRPPTSAYGWSEHLKNRAAGTPPQGGKTEKITFRQLANYMSGFGREYPLKEAGNWPVDRNETTPPSDTTSLETVLRDILGNPLVTTPYSYPVYSNVGFGLLGISNVAASVNKTGGGPKSHKDLVKRDIFDPLGMDSSFYVVPSDESVKSRMAVSANTPGFVDLPLGDTADGAGGQYSSLSDLAKLMQVLLSPTAPNPEFEFFPTLTREWLRPQHVWADGSQAVGAPWEIEYIDFGHSPKRVSIYHKAGDLSGFHALFSVNPEYGYGIVTMVSGDFTDTYGITAEALDKLQPAFQKTLEKEVKSTYVGHYDIAGGHGYNAAEVKLIDGQLMLTRLEVNGVNILQGLQQPMSDSTRGARPHAGRKLQPGVLWNTGRLGEFRVTFGRAPMSGCLPRWASIDPAFINHGAAIDLVYWEDGNLVYPSANVKFTKRR